MLGPQEFLHCFLQSSHISLLFPDESSSSGGQQLSPLGQRPPCGSDTDSSIEEESDFDTMPEIESDKNVIRTKVLVLLTFVSRTSPPFYHSLPHALEKAVLQIPTLSEVLGI